MRQFVHHDKSAPFTKAFKMLLYHDNFFNHDSFKIAKQLLKQQLIEISAEKQLKLEFDDDLGFQTETGF